MIVAASEVTNNFSRWLMIILFNPRGPYADLRVLANSVHASMLRRRDSSTPEKYRVPSLSIEPMPGARGTGKAIVGSK